MLSFHIEFSFFVAALILDFILFVKTVKKKNALDKKPLLIAGEIFCFIYLLTILLEFPDGFYNQNTREIYVLLYFINEVSFNILLLIFLRYTMQLILKEESIAFKIIWYFMIGFCCLDSFVMISNVFPGHTYQWAMQLKEANFIVIEKIVNEPEGRRIITQNVIKGLTKDGGFWTIPHYFYIYLSCALIISFYLVKCFSIPRIYRVLYFTLSGAIILLIGWKTYHNFSKPLIVCDSSQPIYSIFVASMYFYIYHNRSTLMLLNVWKISQNKLNDPILLFDMNNKLVDFNTKAKDNFGLDLETDVLELSLSNFLKNQLNNQVTLRQTSTVEDVTIFIPPSERLVYSLDYNVIRDKKKRLVATLLIFNDVTQISKMYRTLDDYSVKDELTGLKNKVALQKKIAELNMFRRFPFSALVCEIKGHATIRDGIGQETADRVARYVGDILLSELKHEHFASYNDGVITILMPTNDEKYVEEFARNFDKKLIELNPLDCPVSIDYGIRQKTTPDDDMQTVINNAQFALYRKRVRKGDVANKEFIESLRKTLEEANEGETKAHCVRTSKLAVGLGRRLGYSDEVLEKLDLLAQFHDIGKLSVPDKLLMKDSSLTNDEREVMVIHTIRGKEIAEKTPDLQCIADEILYHHERVDGTGYPSGLKGEQIPILSRIMAIVDSFDVMTHNRPYHKAISIDSAIKELKDCAGTQFDKSLVGAFIGMIEGRSNHDLDQEFGYLEEVD